MNFKIIKKPEGELQFSGEDIRILYIPLFIEQCFNVFVGLSDSVMVASCGEAVLSGVSLVDMITNVILHVFAALATGGAVVTSQYIGAKRHDMAQKTAWQLTFVTFFLATLLTTSALCFKRGILSGLFGSIDDEVMKNAVTYFSITALSYPFWGIYNSCAALFRSMGNSKISMKVTVLMNISNITGNAILIFGFNMGAAGAAYSTLFARVLAAVIMIIALTNKENIVHLDFSSFPKPDFSEIKKILRIGVPNGFENGLFQLGRVLVISIVSVFGTAQIAANAAASNIANICLLPAQAMSLTMVTVVGQCMGAKLYKQIYYYVKKLMGISYIVSAAVSIIIFISMPLILNIFNLSPEAERITSQLVNMHMVAANLMWTVAFVLPNALRAAGDATYTMVFSLFSMAVFRLTLSYVLGLKLQMGVIGVWLAMFTDWIFRSVCFVLRFASGKWKEKKLIDT